MQDEEKQEKNQNVLDLSQKQPFDNAQGDSAESEDDVVEFEYNEDGEEDLKKTLKKLRADLKQAKKEKEE